MLIARLVRNGLFPLLALTCLGCATAPDRTDQAADPQEEKFYRTGSHIPVRYRQSSIITYPGDGDRPVKTMDSQSAQDWLNKNSGVAPGVKGQ